LVAEVVVVLEAFPFESTAESVVVVSVLTFLPLSLVSVFVIVLESVVDVSVFWAMRAVAVKSEANMIIFMSFISRHARARAAGHPPSL